MNKPVFYPCEILLPEKNTDMSRWGSLACDQFTSEPEYWQKAESFVGEAPSTLKMVLPEVYLEQDGVEQRIQAIHATMKDYAQSLLSRVVDGYVYVERTCQSGMVRQGLLGCVDLEDYSFEKSAPVKIRPSENTVVERIPPRLAVRRGAVLELPHILMLLDDQDQTVIEPLADKTQNMELLYDQQLMLGGGRIRGWAVTDPKELERIAGALARLDQPEKFREKYGVGQDSVNFVFAVGDGNHSLATAKAAWEEIKTTLTEEQRQNHPARYCMVELENVQSPAIEIEPIHRVLFETDGGCLLRSFAQYIASKGAKIAPVGEDGQQLSILSGSKRVDLCVQDSPFPLAAGTVEDFLLFYGEDHPEMRVDYVHGEDSVQQLVEKGAVGVLLPPFEKGDLFRGVAQGGVLPKKTFSMGHAEEKRYYLECRKIVE